LGAGTATVTNAIADHINVSDAPMDRVTGEQLGSRVMNSERA
jgi:hypothetical protein